MQKSLRALSLVRLHLHPNFQHIEAVEVAADVPNDVLARLAGMRLEILKYSKLK